MGRGVVLLIVSAVLLAAVIVTRPWDDTADARRPDPAASTLTVMPASEPEQRPPPGDGRTVSLGDANVLLRYPEGYTLVVDGDQLDKAAAKACGSTFEYCLFPSTTGAQEGSAGLAVTQRQDLETEASCVLDPTAEFADRLPSVGGGGDHATATFGWIDDTAESGGEGTGLRRLYFDGTCFEFVTRVFAGSAEEKASMRQGLSAILDDVALPDGRTGLWSSGV